MAVTKFYIWFNILLLFFLLLLVHIYPAYSDIFTIEELSPYKQITVHSENEFTVRLKGRGWYLNRYDKQKLEFKIRSFENDYTEFSISPIGKGSSYLLFSYLEKDVYILVEIVKIDEIIPEQQGKISDKGEGVDEGVELKKEGKKITEKVPVVSEKATKVPEQLKPLQKDQATLDEPKTLQRAQETLNEPKTLKKDQETLDEPGPVQEEKIREQDTVLKKESKATAEESSLSHGKNKKLAKKSTELPDKGKKPHIYYTDENKRRVKVPFRSEDDDFLEAVELYGKNQLQEAVSKLEHYLEDCTGCRYQNEAKMKIAQIYMDMGQTQKSLGYLDEIINGNSGKYAAQAYQKKADIMYAEGKYEEALHSYTKAYGYTDALDILKKIGDIHFQLEQYEKAAEVYQKALHAGMKNDMMVFRLASIYDTPGKMRDIEKAYNYYEDLLDEYETSKYQGIAKERINFFNKNFYNYK